MAEGKCEHKHTQDLRVDLDVYPPVVLRLCSDCGIQFPVVFRGESTERGTVLWRRP